MTSKVRKPHKESAPNQVKAAPSDKGLDYRIIFNAANNGMAFTEFDSGKIIDVNDAWIRSTGITRENAVGKTALKLGLWASRTERAACMAEISQKGYVVDFEARLVMKSVESLHLISGRAVEMGGQRRVLWEFRDISDQKKANEALLKSEEQIKSLLAESEQSRRALLSILEDERLTKNALQESEERYRNLFESVPVGLYRSTLSGQIQDVNLATIRMLGYERREEVTVHDAGDFWVHPEIRNQLASQLDQEGMFDLEIQMRRRDQKIIWVRNRGRAVLDDRGQILFYEGSLEDISERKRAEQALRDSEEQFRVIFEKANDAIHIDSLNDEILDVNSRMCELMGYSREELLKMRVSDLQAPEVKIDSRVVETELARHGSAIFEGINLHRDGRRIPVEISIGEIEFSSGPHYVSIVRDITERKQAEKELRDSEEKFSRIFQISPALMAISTLGEGRFVDVNETFLETLGFDRRDVLGKSSTDLGLFSDAQQRAQAVRMLSETGFLRNFEILIRAKNGEEHTGLFSGIILQLHGQPFLLTIMNDITERKKAEGQIRDALNYANTLIESSPVGIVTFKATGEIISANQALLKIVGATWEALRAQNFRQLESWKDSGLLTMAEKALTSGEGQTIEAYVVSTFDRGFWCSCYFTPFQYEGETRLLVLMNDITERRQAEEFSRRANAALAEAQRISHLGSWNWDLETGKIQFSEEMFRLVGLMPGSSEITRKAFTKFLHPDEAERILQEFLQCTAASACDIEHRIVQPNGKVLYVQSRIKAYCDENGVPLRLLGSTQDVTERKQAEEAMKESEERLSSFISFASDSFYLLDAGLNFVEINKKGLEIIGKSREDVVGKNIADIVPDVKTSGRYEKHLEVLRTGNPFTVDDFIPHPVFGDMHFVLKSFKAGDFLGVIASDVTKRKQAEDNLNRQMERLRALHTIEQTVTSSTDLKTILELLVSEVVEQLHIDAVSILLLNEQTQTLDFAAREGFRTEALRYTSLEIGAGMAGLAAREKKIVQIADLNAMENNPALAKSVEHENFISYFGVPLVAKGQLLGVMEIFQRSTLASDPDWLAFLETLAGQAAISIHNARLLETTRQGLMDTDALYRINRDLVALTDTEQLMYKVVDLLQEKFEYSYVQIFTTDPQTEECLLRAGSGEVGKQLLRQGHHMAAGEGIVGYTAETGTSFFTNDVNSVVFYKQNPVLPGVKSELTVPIKTGDRLLGMLDVQQIPPAHLSQHDLQLVGAVADQLAVALQKARLYADLQEALKKEQAIRDQLIQSERLAVAGRLLASVSHELNNPLQAIQNALFLLKDESGISAQGKQDMSIVISETERMSAMLERLRVTYQPPRAEDFEPVQLNDLIESVFALTATHLRHRDISFEFHSDPVLPAVAGLPDQLRQVLLNLFVNAAEAMNNGGRLIVTTAVLAESKEVMLMVEDTGPGIEPSILPHIFEAFVTNKTTGTGLGLSISYEIILKHGGRIQASNRPEGGALFSVWLPVNQKGEGSTQPTP